MSTMTAIPASGKVTSVKDGLVVFAPINSNYQLHLIAPRYQGPVNTRLDAVIRVTARKIWTVPSGGNFISPIFGTPRTIQGRIRSLDETSMVIQAGAPILVEFPSAESGFDLVNGPLKVGSLVNVMVMPGARFELKHD